MWYVREGKYQWNPAARVGTWGGMSGQLIQMWGKSLFLFKILNFCSSQIFYDHIDFFKYCIKILFLLITLLWHPFKCCAQGECPPHLTLVLSLHNCSWRKMSQHLPRKQNHYVLLQRWPHRVPDVTLTKGLKSEGLRTCAAYRCVWFAISMVNFENWLSVPILKLKGFFYNKLDIWLFLKKLEDLTH